MTIDELIVGQKIMVDVSFGESRIEYASEVLGSNGPGIYITPYYFKGVVIDFRALNFQNLSYNIHVVDSKGVRNAWMNVDVSIAKYNGKEQYLVQPKSFMKFSQSSERRENGRLEVSCGGNVTLPGGEVRQCSLRDISDTGISFYASSGLLSKGEQADVSFYDIAKNTPCSVTLKMRVVRIEEREEGTLYAGNIVLGRKEAVGYICLKRMEKKAEESYKF